MKKKKKWNAKWNPRQWNDICRFADQLGDVVPLAVARPPALPLRHQHLLPLLQPGEADRADCEQKVHWGENWAVAIQWPSMKHLKILGQSIGHPLHSVITSKKDTRSLWTLWAWLLADHLWCMYLLANKTILGIGCCRYPSHFIPLIEIGLVWRARVTKQLHNKIQIQYNNR